jgi:hypothetical protein
MSEPEEFRAKAREYAARAKETDDLHEAVRLKGIAKSYLLLEKNAKWVHSTDRFLAAVKANRKWPSPTEENADEPGPPPSGH